MAVVTAACATPALGDVWGGARGKPRRVSESRPRADADQRCMPTASTRRAEAGRPSPQREAASARADLYRAPAPPCGCDKAGRSTADESAASLRRGSDSPAWPSAKTRTPTARAHAGRAPAPIPGSTGAAGPVPRTARRHSGVAS
ncbi:hypothetical protein OG883_20450 [Streptomyces sp. NBC_01142]|uniref:hypothetical protein n=1 Tax=Streptomyces sp. NBC_01142 TaxID=2975865 RepID=UPI0022504D9F|nr:hypothetical protein [Streptomyces sp. NBC_01142]MCX4822215.1 hypothetical protein [Streptomyces sp. NBC_01142]